MPRDRRDDVEEFEVTYLTETKLAVLVEVDGAEHWIPNSQIDEDSEVFVGCNLMRGDRAKLICTVYIATQKGLV